MGCTVADARMAFQVMAGPDPRDPHSVALLDVPPPAKPRIAVSPRLGLNVAVDADVMAAFQGASALLYGKRHAQDKDLLGDNVAGLIERGRNVTGTDVVAAFRFADDCARRRAILHRV
jgi:aspartyl-tRNA(Asn)/glutamyl-tRNA(Gln) amidotransferase subunit A